MKDDLVGGTISISGRAELYEALARTQGGEILLLAPGDYGALTLNAKPGFSNKFAETLTIASADANSPARFDWMDIHGGQNIAVDGVILDYTFRPGDPDYVRPFEVNGSQNITITNTLFAGDLVLSGAASPLGFGHGFGLSVRDSAAITIEGNEFTTWGRAAIISQSREVTVRGNNIHSVRSDGLNFAEVVDVVIENNQLYDFNAAYGSADHRDMIQFWTTGTESPSAQIVIRNNRLDMGEGSFTQSIFMRNEAVDSHGAHDGMFYRDVTIEGNTIYNGHIHGITVGETDGLTVRGNSLIAVADPLNPNQDDSALWVPAINIAAATKNLIIDRNVAGQINGHEGQADWHVAGNVLIQNHSANLPGYYGDVFVSSKMAVTEKGHHFIAQPGMMMNAGVVEIQTLPNLDTAEALFQVAQSQEGAHMRVFDAGLTAQMLSKRDLEGATFTWQFSDGTSAQGQLVTHAFSSAGTHDVHLTVHAKGQDFRAACIVDIRGGKLLSYDENTGRFTAHGFGQSYDLDTVGSTAESAIHLTGQDVIAIVDKSLLEGLSGSDAFALDFKLQGTGAGELFRMHMSFHAEITKGGAVSFQMFDQNGKSAIVTSRGVWVNDGLPHDVTVLLKDGILELRVDDAQTAIARFAGTLPTVASWDLSFGNPWGQKANFEGSISAFELAAGKVLPALRTGAAENEPFALDAELGAELPGGTQLTYSETKQSDTQHLAWGATLDFGYGEDLFDQPGWMVDAAAFGFDAFAM